MPIEPNVQYIDDLDPANPPATDPLSQVDDHLKLIKTAVKQSFPGITGPVTATHTELNGLDGRVSTLENADAAAIANNSGTPSFAPGITAAEIRDLIDLGTLDDVQFSQVRIGANWRLAQIGTKLYISYVNGSNTVHKVTVDSSGNVRATGDVIAVASV